MESLYGADDYFQFVKPYQEAMDFLMVQIKVLNEDYREKYRDYPIHNASELKACESRLYSLKEENEANQVIKIKNEINNNRRLNNELIDKLAITSNQTVYRQIEERIEEKTKRIERLEEKMHEIENRQNDNEQQFIDFALNFADNLGAHFFEIDLSLIKEFKLLLFPGGFFVNSENKVYTTIVSPFYRLRTTKKTSEDASWDIMVRVKRL